MKRVIIPDRCPAAMLSSPLPPGIVVVGDGPAARAAAAAAAAAGAPVVVVGEHPPQNRPRGGPTYRRGFAWGAWPDAIGIWEDDRCEILASARLVITDAPELARSAGCALVYARGGFRPRRDRQGRTSLGWLFVAGSAVGAGDPVEAAGQGLRAGRACARDLGFDAVAPSSAVDLDRILPPALKAGIESREGGSPVPGLLCACEGLTISAFLAALPEPTLDANVARALTRVGMGICQGRDCEAAVVRALARQRGRPARDVVPFTYRPPVRPLRLGALAAEVAQPPLQLVFP